MLFTRGRVVEYDYGVGQRADHTGARRNQRGGQKHEKIGEIERMANAGVRPASGQGQRQTVALVPLRQGLAVSRQSRRHECDRRCAWQHGRDGKRPPERVLSRNDRRHHPERGKRDHLRQ
jgi:hypothetical protein